MITSIHNLKQQHHTHILLPPFYSAFQCPNTINCSGPISAVPTGIPSVSNAQEKLEKRGLVGKWLVGWLVGWLVRPQKIGKWGVMWLVRWRLQWLSHMWG